MIGSDVHEAERFIQAFRAAAGQPGESVSTNLEATATDPMFPGAILPWYRGPGNVTVYYALARTFGEWRRLRPLLLSFAGPTLTNFSGRPHPLNPALSQEAVIDQASPAVVARFYPHPETAASTERALARLMAMVARTPVRADAPPETTNRVLARLRDHLNASAFDDATAILDQCRREHRLDALNLQFLEIEILASARDWSAIADLPAFETLVQTRRPPAVTVALLESLYQTAFADVPDDIDIYVRDVRPRARDLIRLPAPPSLTTGAWRLYGMEALCGAPLAQDLAVSALSAGVDLGVLAERIAQLSPRGPRAVQPEETSVEGLIADADIGGTLMGAEQVFAALANLPEAERAELIRRVSIGQGLAQLQEKFGDETPPADWLQWLQAITDPAFTTAASVARSGAEEWPCRILEDPVTAKTLATALDNAPDSDVGADRLLDGLPHFVGWLQRDEAFPRPSSQTVYEAALGRLMYGGRSSAPMLDSAGVLARALISDGLPSAAYSRLLGDLLEFSGEGAGLRTAYWLIEMVEETLAAPAPDQSARERFWQGVIARLQPIAAQLSQAQHILLAGLASALGWQEALPANLVKNDQQDPGLAARLGDMQIAIYTLTEAAAAQAVLALKQLAPRVNVRVNSDHVGSVGLKNLSETADLFVVVAASAKHAATDFIRAKRNNRPLVYAAGRGASSILRAIEDWAQTSTDVAARPS